MKGHSRGTIRPIALSGRRTWALDTPPSIKATRNSTAEQLTNPRAIPPARRTVVIGCTAAYARLSRGGDPHPSLRIAADGAAGQLGALPKDTRRRLRLALAHRANRPTTAALPHAKKPMRSKPEVDILTLKSRGAQHGQHTIRWKEQGMISSAMWCVCAAHWLSIARELDPTRCWLETPWFLLLRLAFQQLSQHMSNIVPHPAYNRQSSSLSVKRAVGAGNGATRGAWKAPGQAAYLARLQSARRGLPRDRRGRPWGAVVNVSVKRLITLNLFPC